MNFSEALIELKTGKKIRRKGWNCDADADQIKYIYLSGDQIFSYYELHTLFEFLQEDILAEDWEVVTWK